jgi:hypothetical protein
MRTATRAPSAMIAASATRRRLRIRRRAWRPSYARYLRSVTVVPLPQDERLGGARIVGHWPSPTSADGMDVSIKTVPWLLFPLLALADPQPLQRSPLPVHCQTNDGAGQTRLSYPFFVLTGVGLSRRQVTQ